MAHAAHMVGEFPYLAGTAFIAPDNEPFANPEALKLLGDASGDIIEMLLHGGYELEEYARLFSRAWQRDKAKTISVTKRLLLASGLAGIANISIPENIQVVIVDRGWHGVHRNAVDLWQRLNSKRRAFLITGTPPPCPYDPRLSDLLMIPPAPATAFHTQIFMAFVRTILLNADYRMVYCTHRSVTPFIADIAERVPVIIHSDGHYEDWLPIGRAFAGQFAQTHLRWSRVLQELYLASGDETNLAYFYGLYRAFVHARENWLWMPRSIHALHAAFPEQRLTTNVVMPFIDAEYLAPSFHDRSSAPLLFTTTYRGDAINEKGLAVLLRVLERTGDINLRLVLSDTTCVPAPLRGHPRISVECGVDRARMREIYHESLANCRISKNDSSPVSILESMACGTPVIVSPLIAKNIPFIEHGKNAIVVEPDDVEALLHAVLLLARDRAFASSIGSEASRAVKKYALLQNMERVLDELIEPPRVNSRAQMR